MKKLIFAIAAMAAGAVSAAVSFSYQGSLKLATGENIPASQANKTITFKLYDTPTGTDALWGRQIAVHLDANGLFNVELSDGAGSDVAGVKTNDLAWVLADNASHDRALYIGLDVEGSSGEIRPRQKLLHVPTAAFASDVATAKRDFTVSGIATFNGVVNASKGLTVSGAELKAENGLTVSGGGLATMKGLTVSGGALKAQNGLEVSGGTLEAKKGLTVSGGPLEAKKGLTVSGDPLEAKNGLTVSGGALAFPGGGGIIPKGGIIMWSGTTPPAGWAICNGENNTPDLRGRFIVGYNPNDGAYNTPGNTGGEASHKLTANELPKHTHPLTLCTHVVYAYNAGDHDPASGYVLADTGFDAGKMVKFTTRNPENSTTESAHENRPPYYVLAFIMKL